MIDFHNHLLPQVDDGAQTLEETRSALQLFQEQGCTTVVTTPHFEASLLEKPDLAEEKLGRFEDAWALARPLAEREFPGITLGRGVELALDVPEPDLSDRRLRLAETSFVLLEFPYMSVPPNATGSTFGLKMKGWIPVLAHPERYGNIAGLEEAAEWRRLGVRLQSNAGSLLGRYGPEVQKRAWSLVEHGLVDYICSDYHCRGTLHLQGCREALEEAGGGEQATLLLEVNAARLLRGESPLPVPPLPRQPPLWRRLLGASWRFGH